MADSPNYAAIKRWFAENRPDIPANQIARLLEEPAYGLLMAGSFEAGRAFQTRNPDAGEFLGFKEYK